MRTLNAMDGMAFKREPLENSYEIGDDIGSGHFAVVRRAVHKKSGDAFAAKFIRKRRGGGRKGAKAEDIQREISILKQLDHENVIRLYDVYETNIEVILILELVTGGELFDYISEKDHLGEEEASAFIAQILRGLKHLHDHSIAHLDLKPENIMLRNRNTQSIKLIDFGLAQRIHGKEDIRALMGTAEFVAPEVVSYETLSLATDMWSVGVITYILLSGASPFLGDNQQETYHNITAINFQFDEEYFSNTSELAKDFIERLFVKIPKKRATVDDCLNHPWIRPKEPIELIKRQSAVINIDNFKAFMARKRWKQSMRVVSLCNRLSKSILLRKSTDTMGSMNTLDEDKMKRLMPLIEAGSESTVTENIASQPNAPTHVVQSIDSDQGNDERFGTNPGEELTCENHEDELKAENKLITDPVIRGPIENDFLEESRDSAEKSKTASLSHKDGSKHPLNGLTVQPTEQNMLDDSQLRALKSQSPAKVYTNLHTAENVETDIHSVTTNKPNNNKGFIESLAPANISSPEIKGHPSLDPTKHTRDIPRPNGVLKRTKTNSPGDGHLTNQTVVSKLSLSPACNQRVLRVSSDVSAGLEDLVIECDDVFLDPQDVKSKRSSVRLTLKTPASTSD